MDQFNLHSAVVTNAMLEGPGYCAQQCLEWPEVLENSRTRRPTICGHCRLDDEGSSDASEEPGTVWNEFWRFSTTGSPRRCLESPPPAILSPLNKKHLVDCNMVESAAKVAHGQRLRLPRRTPCARSAVTHTPREKAGRDPRISNFF